MILSAQTIRTLSKTGLVQPFHERSVSNGMTFGLSACGYDVRIAETVQLRPKGYMLASTMERFMMPDDVMAQVTDKSTWARRFVTVQNSVIEPCWEGWLTLELTNHSTEPVFIQAGSPIAQIVFMRLDEPTEQPYDGKYQRQERGPQPARLETQPSLPGLADGPLFDALERASHGQVSRAVTHVTQRQGDEMACSCGARWSLEEMHP